jgi:Protein of unknown function (DUF2924)
MTTNEREGPTTVGLSEIATELARLERMTAAELCARYIEDFGKPPRTRHRLWLLRAVAFRAQERRLGGLSGAARRRLDELMAEIEIPAAPAGARVPRFAPLANKEPAARTASPAISETRPRSNTSTSGRAEPSLRPGTVITKTWHGRELRLVVQDDGTFELDGVVHRSLTAAAKAATGQHWNGRLFWLGRGR